MACLCFALVLSAIVFFSATVDAQCTGSVLTVRDTAGYFSTAGGFEIPEFPATGQYTIDDVVPRGNGADPLDFVPPDLPANTTCRWLFVPNYRDDPPESSGYNGPIQTIYILFHSLTLQPGATMKFYEGDNATGTLITTLTGPYNGLPPSPVSTPDDIANTTMYVELDTGLLAGSSFDGYWQAGGCMFGTVVLTSQNSSFTDGSGPFVPYSRLSYCGFLIYSQNTSDVISITASGITEPTFDKLNIYDGATPQAGLLAPLTANFSTTFLSSTNMVFLLFSSDKSVVDEGFQVNYEIISATCSGTTLLTDLAGKFSDGSEVAYQANGNCFWHIAPSSDVGYIALYLEDIDLADDHLYVYRGDDATGTLLRDFTGHTDYATIIQEDGLNLFLELKTNNKHQGSGFQATYHAGKCISTVVITELSGIITDGSGNGTYADNSVCTWLVQLDPTQISHIEVTEISFDSEFRFDTFIITDGGGTQLLQISGENSTFAPIKTLSSTMSLTLTTDADTVYQGWTVQYKGIEIDSSDQTIDYADPGSVIFVILLMWTAIFCAVLFIVYIIIIAYNYWSDSIRCATFLAGFIQTGIWFNLYMIFICGLTCFTIFPFIGEPTDGLCAWRIWTVLALFALITPLVLKSVWICISDFMRPKEMRGVLRPKYNYRVAMGFLFMLVFVLAIETVYLILWTAIDAPKPEKRDALTHGDYYIACQSKHHWVWVGIQAGMIGIVVLVGVISSLRAMPITSSYHDSRSTGICIMLMAIGITAFAVAVYLLRAEPQAWIALLGLGIWLGVLAPLILLILYRLFSALRQMIRPQKNRKKKESGTRISKKQINATLRTGPADILDDL